MDDLKEFFGVDGIIWDVGIKKSEAAYNQGVANVVNYINDRKAKPIPEPVNPEPFEEFYDREQRTDFE